MLASFTMALLAVATGNLRSQNATADLIRGIEITNSLPALNGKGELMYTLLDTIHIYYYKEFVLCQFYELPDVAKKDREGKVYFESSGRKLLKLIYKRGASEGYIFHELDKQKSKWVAPLDSAIKANGTPGMELATMLSAANVKLLHSSSGSISGEHKEVYITTDSSHTGDTIFCTFSRKMADVPFSFDPKLDSVKSAKLCHIRFHSAQSYEREYNVTLPARDVVLDIKRKPVANRNEILYYINRFEKLNK